MTPQDINKRFAHHTLNRGQANRCQVLHKLGRDLAHIIDEQCPGSREKSIAMTKLEEAIMWANAAIARNEIPRV